MLVVSGLFPQIVSTKKADGKTYRYLHIVESYREGNHVKKRRIASLGNIDAYSEKEIEQVIAKLESLLQNRVRGSLDDLTPKATLHFGVSYVVQFLWDQLGLTKAIDEGIRGRDVQFDVARYIQAMVINRLIDPASKLRLFETIEDLYLPSGSHDWQLQHFYRALDYLMDMKPHLEKFLYSRLTDLFNFRLSLVLYDLTSTHVTGHHCPIAKHGYTRTHRPDLEQVELGLLVTPDGLPITHEVFSGETADKSTVPEILQRLKNEFNVQQCVFVGDRGMVTNSNLLLLAQAGYPYIVGYHKRGRVVSDALLETYANVADFAKLRDNLYFLEVPTAEVHDEEISPDARYVLCYNPVKAMQDEAFRKTAMDEAEKALEDAQESLARPKRGRKADPQKVLLKIAEALSKKGVQSFWEIDYDGQTLSYKRHEMALAKEALRDGKFIVKTNTDLPAADVVTSYKTLMNIERAFREIKNFLEVGPLHHWNEKRVRGHIFVCVLAYLFEQELQILSRKKWQQEAEAIQEIPDKAECAKQQKELDDRWYTGEKIIQELRRWHVFKGEFIDREFISVPPPSSLVQEVLPEIGIPLPPKLLPVR